MTGFEEPVILELAPLPRDKTGPFLVLGVDKDAPPERIEAAWAQRVIWARKNLVNTPLENVNWAREICNDPERRVRADVGSLNVDTTDQTIQQLENRYSGVPTWQPLEHQSLPRGMGSPDYPNPDGVRDAITVPVVPEEFPAIRDVLGRFVQVRFDPWTVDHDPLPPIGERQTK